MPNPDRRHRRRRLGSLWCLGPRGIAQVAEHPCGPVVVAPALRVVALPMREAFRPVLPSRGSGDELLPHHRWGPDGGPPLALLWGGVPGAAVPVAAPVAAAAATNRRHGCPSLVRGGGAKVQTGQPEGHRLLCCTRGREGEGRRGLCRRGAVTATARPAQAMRDSRCCHFIRARARRGGGQATNEGSRAKEERAAKHLQAPTLQP